MRRLTVQHHAIITTEVEVPDDAGVEEVKEAVVEAVQKYPDVKAGQHFDPEDFTVVEDDRPGLMKAMFTVYYDPVVTSLQTFIDVLTGEEGAEFFTRSDPALVPGSRYDDERGTWVVPDDQLAKDMRRMQPRWRVSYRVVSGIDGGATVHESDVVVTAVDEDAARGKAQTWVWSNDSHADDRIDPAVIIDSVREEEEED